MKNKRGKKKKMKKMRKVFSGCSFYNKKKKGDSWTGSEIREMGEVLNNPICREELAWNIVLRDFRRHFLYPGITIILVAISITILLCYVGV